MRTRPSLRAERRVSGARAARICTRPPRGGECAVIVVGDASDWHRHRDRHPARAGAGARDQGPRRARRGGARPRRRRRRGRARSGRGRRGGAGREVQRRAGRAALPGRRPALAGAGPPARRRLDRGGRAPARQARSRVPIVCGGRSSGARVACRTAADDRRGRACCAWPSRSTRRAAPRRAGRTSSTRVAVPVLVVQGASDPFGMPAPGPREPS